MSGVYVHLPFCRRRCSYCPFAISVDLRLHERYFDALASEIGATCSGSFVDTLYFGGGTPSLSSKGALRRIIDILPSFGAEGEFTFEANPEDIDRPAIVQWQELGVNRLSIGVQSLHEDELRPLGRLHGSRRAIEALKWSLEAGLRTNADLIIGLPGQTRKRFVDSLGPVLDSGVGHLSLYVLDLDEDTPLRRRVDKGRTSLPHEDLVADLYIEAVERSSRYGLIQYEISNFARPGEESRHNLGYWSREPYLGVGLGAHSFDGRKRYSNVRDINEYIARSERGDSTIEFEEEIGEVEAVEEEIFLSLRRREGIAVRRLTDLRGELVAPWIERGVEADALIVRMGTVAFTPRGFLLSNDLIAELF